MAKTILLVEDEEMLLKSIEEHFRKSGFDVVTASNGNEALTQAKEHRPDLVLLDIVLPQKSGLEVLQEMRADKNLHYIPVLMLTNLDDEQTISQAVALGARGYILKADIELKEIVAKVKEILK